MDPFTVSTNIDLPREQVYEYLLDIANHAEFTDHYLVDWRLTREDSYGPGAGARFRIKAPLARFAWADVTIAEALPPFRIVERGRGGKFNRIRMIGTYEIHETSGGGSRVEYTYESETRLPSDRLMEMLRRPLVDPAEGGPGDAPSARDPGGGSSARVAARRSPDARLTRRKLTQDGRLRPP